jgi:dTDP-4-dehydrorhamnose 3,5-epimerase-like enzyme
MAELLTLKTFKDRRGHLTVAEDFEIPFPIKRIFYIYGVDDSIRGGHRHHKTRQALICLTGKCKIESNNGKEKTAYWLDDPSKCLIVEPEDWHIMKNFSENTILLVLASANFNEADYIFENYPE